MPVASGGTTTSPRQTLLTISLKPSPTRPSASPVPPEPDRGKFQQTPPSDSAKIPPPANFLESQKPGSKLASNKTKNSELLPQFGEYPAKTPSAPPPSTPTPPLAAVEAATRAAAA